MRLTLFITVAMIAACSPTPITTPDNPAIERAGPAIAMDCFRETGVSMLAAHRGGPAQGYPENALTSLRRLSEMGVLYAEIDVRRSADGVLFLLHDDTLDRTTTGSGSLDGLNWASLSELNLQDNDGLPTRSNIPTLSETVDLARSTGLILNLDLKSVSPEEIVDFVQDENARDLVAIIAYTVEDAAAIHMLDPGLLLSVPNDRSALQRAGVNLEASYIWLGTGDLDPQADTALADLGLETSAGLFRRENGSPDLYLEARGANIELIAIDDVDTAVQALGGAMALREQIEACSP